jgi:hypothetical protein
MEEESGRRGSDVLRDVYRKGGFTLRDDIVDEIADLTSDLILDHILVRGQPRPDVLHATFTADDPDRCGTVVGGILGLLGRHGTAGLPAVVKVFPKGIPVPDHFQVQLDLGVQGQ